MNKQVHIIGGGTVFHIRPHLALSAPAYGQTAWDLAQEVTGHSNFEGEVHIYTTKMAGDVHQSHAVGKRGKITYLKGHNEEDSGHGLETNEDVAKLIDKLVEDPAPKIIFLPAALCDFDVERIDDNAFGSKMDNRVGKEYDRLKTGQVKPHVSMPYNTEPLKYILQLKDSEKIIRRIREKRKDIFLVGFKTTTGAAPNHQFEEGLKLLKNASCNLVLANDIKTRMNMIITPEQAPYEPTKDRGVALATLVDMALSRAQGHFTRTLQVAGAPIQWRSDIVPASLRDVVDHCVKRGAYKPFLGSTVGHFAFKVEDGKFVTSMRKTDFNYLDQTGMVLVESFDDDSVLAYGAKPSVGGQSQRIIFKNHPDMDCIVHFHCPLKDKPQWSIPVPVKSQYHNECGSHECGRNTSEGLQEFLLTLWGQAHKIKVVMLDKHGPNIVFNRDTPPQAVIDFIEANWDLERSTSELPF